MKNWFLLILLLISCLSVFGQKEIIVTGTVKDTNDNPLPYIDVLIKKNDSLRSIVAYDITDEYGRYKIIYQTSQNKLVLETSSLTHETQNKLLNISKNTVSFFEDIILVERIEELEEVELRASPRVQVKNDTTSFNLNKLTDGTERVVEEILKKLPGVTIRENGRLRFKGKDIKNVLLDGDNLFNGNYTIGTQNINANHIVGVEAIENFEDNPLLQGLSENDEVALNLKFGDGISLSGDAETSVANRNRYSVNLKNIGITKKIKGFSVFSYNNMGNQLNNNQFSARDFIQTLKNQTKSNLVTPNYIIDDGLFSESNNVANNEFFGSINILPKLSDTEILRVNIDALSDKSMEFTESLTIIRSDTEDPIRIEQTNNKQLNPTYLNAIFDYKKFISKNKSLSTSFRVSKLRNNIESQGVRNSLEQIENIQFNELFLSNSTTYTNRITKKSALKFSGQFVLSERPESLYLVPGINFLTNSTSEGSNNTQDAYSIKRTLQLSTNYYRKYRKKDKLNLNLSFNYFENDLISSLTATDETKTNLNNIDYSVFLPEVAFDYFYEMNKFSMRPLLKTKLYSFEYKDLNADSELDGIQLLYDASVRFKYQFNKRNSLSTGVGHFNNLPEEKYLYSNLILRPNRVLQNNAFNFENFTSNIINVTYRYDNLLKNTDLNLGFTYENVRDKYLSLNNVNNDVFFITYLFQNNNAENKILDFSFTKYVSALRSTFRFTATHTETNYLNFLNSSELRFNKSKLTDAKLSIGTSFIGKFLFGNNLSFTQNSFSTQSTQGFQNAGLENDFEITYVPNEQLRIDSNINYFLPNIEDSKINTLRLDASINFSNKKKTITYSLNARNILNQSLFNSINNTDFSTSFSSERIFERLFILTINFKY